MSGLLFLSEEDFVILKGNKGNILCNNIQGFSLILFYSTQCKYCHELIPVFKKLPGTIGGCQFGMINVSKNKEVVIKSQQTIAPIKYVPYIVLHVNGKPYMKYQGPRQMQEISRFIIEVSNKLKDKQQFLNKNNKKEQDTEEEIGIPSYTIGKPLYGPLDKVCYLEFDIAYNDNK